jgi:hypothetical protein
VNPDCAAAAVACEALRAVRPTRGVIAKMDMTEVAINAANRILFLCMEVLLIEECLANEHGRTKKSVRVADTQGFVRCMVNDM